MSVTYTAKKISPMLAATNMEETVTFYQDVLGFNPMMKSSDYSIVERESTSCGPHLKKL
jgi:catechol-2,3-dioxygenase